jgi:hypothetical protein
MFCFLPSKKKSLLLNKDFFFVLSFQNCPKNTFYTGGGGEKTHEISLS